MLIWGTGRIAMQMTERYFDLEQIEAFIDNDPKKTEFMDKRVLRPADVVNMEYDTIVVLTTYAREIYRQSKELGIDTAKMIFAYGNCVVDDLNQDYEFVKRVCGDRACKEISERYCLIQRPPASGDLCLERCEDLRSELSYQSDIVRLETFNLVVKEMRKRNIRGSTAEVGVFRGEFAQYINRAFPEETLYLFDTFEGFSDSEAQTELERGNCTKGFIDMHRKTSIEAVLCRMKYPEKVVVKQGLFPASLGGLEDVFSFVSIDVDFERSILDCIEYFYPRMKKGGYIFVHDYNSMLRGVEKAVDAYESRHGILINKVPIFDSCGTLVISV